VDGKPRDYRRGFRDINLAGRTPSILLPFQFDRSKLRLGKFQLPVRGAPQARSHHRQATGDIARMMQPSSTPRSLLQRRESQAV